MKYHRHGYHYAKFGISSFTLGLELLLATPWKLKVYTVQIFTQKHLKSKREEKVKIVLILLMSGESI